MSSQYANGVSGRVTYVHPEGYTGYVWNQIELPIVMGRMKNGLVGGISEMIIDGK